MSIRQDKTIVAVDGPSASGKSTVSREAARILGFLYVDSGAMYRGVTWKAINEAVDTDKPESVIDMISSTNWHWYSDDDDKVMKFTIDGDDPSNRLRSEPVRERVSDIAAIPEVREFIVKLLRETAGYGSLVMEGRDIGSLVFPNADFKFYLDADPDERARRRYRELLATEGRGNEKDVMDSLTRRDKKDSSRSVSPLQIPLGARVINTTGMSIDDVVRTIVGVVQAGEPA